ncbi:MAG: hypothetical protein C4527_22550 [Candidatus Omnitrophota bacterium]|jgi:hypothetical protein|nr:MAG: hypothetical protein C4527_22550 [Candidatus Omnitrophota bacterium]
MLKRKSYFLAICLIGICTIGQSAENLEQKEWKNLPLYDGESLTFGDVTVKLVQTPVENQIDGKLILQGPDSSQEIIWPQRFKNNWRREYLYFNEIALSLEMRLTPLPPQKIYFTIDAFHQLPKYELTAVPFQESLLVSQECPIFIGPWKFQTVCSDQKQEILHLLINNTEKKSVQEFPITQDTLIKFNRFTISIDVGNYSTATCAARLQFNVMQDNTIVGKNALANQWDFQGVTYNEFFNRLSIKYKFEVEWINKTTNPEMIQRIQEMSLSSGTRGQDDSIVQIKETVENALNRWLQRIHNPNYKEEELVLKWKDDTHLQVCPKNPEMLLKKMHEEQERRDKYLAERKRIEDLFRAQYQLQTKVYPLKAMTPITAKAFIDPILKMYILAYPGVEVGQIEIIERVEDNNLMIASTNEIPEDVKNKEIKRNMLHDILAEQVIADEKGNTVILTAIPATHEKVTKMLEKMEEMMQEQRKKEIPQTYTIELVLLEGGKFPQKQEPKFLFKEDAEKHDQLLNKKLEGQYTPRDTDLKHILDQVLRQNGIPYVFEAEKSPKITFNLLNPTIKDILDKVTSESNLRYQWMENGNLWIGENSTSPNGWTTDMKVLQKYGIDQKDLELFQFEAIRDLAKGIVHLLAEHGEVGVAQLSLSDQYYCKLAFQDLRSPYLVVKGSFYTTQNEKPLLENTIFLQEGKPALLGITNLRQALILVLRLK